MDSLCKPMKYVYKVKLSCSNTISLLQKLNRSYRWWFQYYSTRSPCTFWERNEHLVRPHIQIYHDKSYVCSTKQKKKQYNYSKVWIFRSKLFESSWITKEIKLKFFNIMNFHLKLMKIENMGWLHIGLWLILQTGNTTYLKLRSRSVNMNCAKRTTASLKNNQISSQVSNSLPVDGSWLRAKMIASLP